MKLFDKILETFKFLITTNFHVVSNSYISINYASNRAFKHANSDIGRKNCNLKTIDAYESRFDQLCDSTDFQRLLLSPPVASCITVEHRSFIRHSKLFKYA